MSIIQAAGAGETSTGFYPHTIDNSLRFGDGDVGYLSRTFGTPTDSNKWTLSLWVKSCGNGVRFLDVREDRDWETTSPSPKRNDWFIVCE